MRISILTVLAGTTLGWASPLWAAVTFDNLQISASVATYATDGSIIDSENKSSPPGNIGVIQPLFTASVQSSSNVGPITSDAMNTTSLAFSGPGALALTVDNTGSLVLPTPESSGFTNASGQVNYSFTLATARAFSFSHIFSTTSPSTFNGVILSSASGGPMDPPIFQQFGSGALAAASGRLSAGRYRLFLASTSGLNFTGRERGEVTETTSSTLRFNLTAVPEPATWASMIVGFLSAGGAMRIRRREPRNA